MVGDEPIHCQKGRPSAARVKGSKGRRRTGMPDWHRVIGPAVLIHRVDGSEAYG